MFLNPIKEINSLIKELNKLLIKGASNIHLIIKIEKNWRSQNFDFLRSKNLWPGHFLESSNSYRYHWILKLLVAT